MCTIVFRNPHHKKTLNFFNFILQYENIHEKDIIMLIPSQILTLMQTYLPELFGALLTFFALNFLGKDEEQGKNNLSYAALAFLFLSFKDIILFGSFILADYVPFIIPQRGIDATAYFLQSTSVILMFVGGLQSLKVFKVVKRELTLILCLIAILASVWVVLRIPATWQIILPTIYLIVGFFFLGFCFALPHRHGMNQILRKTGLTIILLGFYYLFTITPWGIENQVHSWGIEAILYCLVILSTILSTTSLLKEQVTVLQRELKFSKAKIPLFIQASPYPIIISQLKDDRLMLVNEKASDLFNIDIRNPKIFRTEEYYVDPNARKELLRRLADSSVVENFQALLRKPGTDETFWLEMSARVIDFENEVALYTAFKDITAQKQHEQDLFEKAVKDPLTGCYNRRQFQELANKEIRRAWRYNNTFTLIMLDIDHFKKVNDTHGHAAGDEVLKALAACITGTLRTSDIFARYGGEEFIILLPETTIENGYLVAERIREKVAALMVPVSESENIHFTISLGVVESTYSSDINELTKYADAALYASKENGRNKTTVYGDGEVYEKEVPAPKTEDTSAEKLQADLVKQAQEDIEKMKYGSKS